MTKQREALQAWKKMAFDLAQDYAVESLRVGIYRQRKSYGDSSATWKLSMLEKKKEAAKHRLEQHLVSLPLAEPEQGRSAGAEPFYTGV